MIFFHSLALAALTLGSLPPQDSSAGALPVVKLADLVLKTYEVQHNAPDELARTLESLNGRLFFVEDNGGTSSAPLQNIGVLGQRVILYDTQQEVARCLRFLEELDHTSSAPTTPADQWIVSHFVPRYVSLETVERSLGAFRNQFPAQSGGQNLSTVPEQRLLVIRDTPSKTQQMLELLRSIDVPEPQVLMTCYVLRADVTGAAPPKELVTNLAKLLPEFQFHVEGFGMLQTSVGANRKIELQVSNPGGVVYHFACRPAAWDEVTKSLTVESCELKREEFVEQTGVPTAAPRISAGIRQVFSTSTLFRANEYTVLGATGPSPVLFAVRLSLPIATGATTK